MLDYIRIACAVPAVRVGDVAKNVETICASLENAENAGADVLLLPELSLTGCTCADLFFQDVLWKGVCEGIKTLLAASENYPALTVVAGLPVRVGSHLLNCAGVVRAGKLLGLVPKTNLSPAEQRWFTDGEDIPQNVSALDAPVSPDLLFDLGDGALAGIVLGDDLFAPIPVSTTLCLGGATVILNPAAAQGIAGSRSRRTQTVKTVSTAGHCVYASCSAGRTESTTDAVYTGHCLIAENGRLLAENDAVAATDVFLIADCDLAKPRTDRRNFAAFRRSAWNADVLPTGQSLRADGTLYPVRKLSFVPETAAARAARCREIFELQVSGLQQRMSVIGCKCVIGISGGLDSTLALLVAVEATRRLGRPLSDVYGITMPCFGTSDRTYENAWALMRLLGITAKEISVKDAVTLHFRDIGHDPTVFNGTYENTQARERTQILMDYASRVGGIVVGTGDLSELALGWCTYNGDHMSMYAVNATVPKTLIRWIIEEISSDETFAPAKSVLADILDTPISPELLPPDASGKISQYTEDLVGPYALHVFFLYHMIRWGFGPKKIYTLACRAFRNDFAPDTIKKWLVSFLRRFFTQQFKRSCMSDGVKIGAVSLGPRGDWSMPSDATAKLWLEEAEQL